MTKTELIAALIRDHIQLHGVPRGVIIRISGFLEAAEAIVKSVTSEEKAPHERQWTGPGHLEETGYIDKQARCPTCGMTEEGYKRHQSWAACTDQFHPENVPASVRITSYIDDLERHGSIEHEVAFEIKRRLSRADSRVRDTADSQLRETEGGSPSFSSKEL